MADEHITVVTNEDGSFITEEDNILIETCGSYKYIPLTNHLREELNIPVNTVETQNDELQVLSSMQVNLPSKLWTNETTLLLLHLIRKYEKELDTSVKKYVWQKIAKELSEKSNYTYTATQVDTKRKTLLKMYKDVQSHNNTSGKNKKYWEYYDTIHNMVFKKPEISAVATCSSYKGLIVKEKENIRLNASVPDTSKVSESEEEYESSFSKKRKRKEDETERRHKERMDKIDKLQGTLNRLVTIFETKKARAKED